MDHNNPQGHELGWEDTISVENEYIVLPAGDYDFKVEKFERARFNGSEKIPPCNQANLTIVVKDPSTGQDVRILHNLILHTKCEGFLSEFFRGIGQKKKNEPLRMNWQLVPGASGRCKIVPEEYNGNKYNKIKKFYPKEDTQPNYNQQFQYKPGQF